TAEDPGEVRAIARTLEDFEERLNAADNDLGETVEAWAERETETMLAEAHRLLQPLFARAAALEHAGADGQRLGDLLDLADALDVKPERDLESAESKLAERVRATRERLGDALGRAECGRSRRSLVTRRVTPSRPLSSDSRLITLPSDAIRARVDSVDM